MKPKKGIGKDLKNAIFCDLHFENQFIDNSRTLSIFSCSWIFQIINIP